MQTNVKWKYKQNDVTGFEAYSKSFHVSQNLRFSVVFCTYLGLTYTWRYAGYWPARPNVMHISNLVNLGNSFRPVVLVRLISLEAMPDGESEGSLSGSSPTQLTMTGPWILFHITLGAIQTLEQLDFRRMGMDMGFVCHNDQSLTLEPEISPNPLPSTPYQIVRYAFHCIVG